MASEEGEIDPVGSNRRPGQFPDPPPPPKSCVRGGGGPSPLPQTPDWVVAWIPPTPPLRTLILGPSYLQNRPENGPIFPVFWGLRCKVLGGWGGSAHYPDPTAQSAPSESAEPRPRRRVAGTASAASQRPNLPKSAKNAIFFSQQLLKVGARGGGEGGVGNSLRECGPLPDSRCRSVWQCPWLRS